LPESLKVKNLFSNSQALSQKQLPVVMPLREALLARAFLFVLKFVKYRNMVFPNFNEEKFFWKQGNKIVIGLDEAGRGPLAGPVVAGAVYIKKFPISGFSKVRDSKMLSVGERENIYEKIIADKNIEWGVGIVSEKIIDKINILQASKLAMKKAVKNLENKIQCARPECVLLIDGNFRIGTKYFEKPIIKADCKVVSCAAASIIAKVTRDRLMEKYHKKYPKYGFDRHKGYPTSLHYANLMQYGPCKIHRKTFYPVSSMSEKI